MAKIKGPTYQEKRERLQAMLSQPFPKLEGSCSYWEVYVVESSYGAGSTWEHVTGDIVEAFEFMERQKKEKPDLKWQVIDAKLVPKKKVD